MFASTVPLMDASPHDSRCRNFGNHECSVTQVLVPDQKCQGIRGWPNPLVLGSSKRTMGKPCRGITVG